MALLEETAAIVAAQLTVAWAARGGARPNNATDQEVLATYEYFKTQVGKRPSGAQKVSLGGA